MKDISLVFMLGGLSSRFGGRAKGFADIGPNGENLLEYSLNQALTNDFKKIVFIVSPKTEEQFRAYYGDSYEGVPIVYAMQEYNEAVREKPWGTNDALCAAKDLINGPFVVCSGDDVYGAGAFTELFNHLQESDEAATVGYKLGNVLSKVGSVNRGIFDTDDGYVKTITETMGITRENMNEKGLNENSLCSMAFFGLQKSTLDMLDEILTKFKMDNLDSTNSECYLPKELGYLITKNKIKMKAYSTDERWIGVTRPEDEPAVRKILSEFSVRQ